MSLGNGISGDFCQSWANFNTDLVDWTEGNKDTFAVGQTAALIGNIGVAAMGHPYVAVALETLSAGGIHASNFLHQLTCGEDLNTSHNFDVTTQALGETPARVGRMCAESFSDALDGACYYGNSALKSASEGATAIRDWGYETAGYGKAETAQATSEEVPVAKASIPQQEEAAPQATKEKRVDL